jgi:L-fuconolactonase
VIIDGHLHLFRTASILRRTVDELAPPDRDAPVEDLLAVQGEFGIDAAVVVPLGPEDEYLGEVLTRYPHRFAGIAVADLATQGRAHGVDAVSTLLRRRERVGFHGLRTGWIGDPVTPLESSPMFPVLRRMAREELILWSYLPAEQLPLLEQVVRTLPDLRVVLNHLGFCPHDMRVDEHRRPRFDTSIPWPTFPRTKALARFPQVHLMFSGHYAFSRDAPPYPDLGPVVRPLVEAFGASRTLWATDYPWTHTKPGFEALLSLAERSLPDASNAELEDIMGGTATRLFPELVTTGKD